jgi:hypothetical protein
LGGTTGILPPVPLWTGGFLFVKTDIRYSLFDRRISNIVYRISNNGGLNAGSTE